MPLPYRGSVFHCEECAKSFNNLVNHLEESVKLAQGVSRIIDIAKNLSLLQSEKTYSEFAMK